MTDETTDAGVAVSFHPQQWAESPGMSHESGRKQLTDADSRETVTYVVPRADATDPDGNIYPDESYEANQLATHPAAPDWVSDWDGPYFVTTAPADEDA